MQVSQASTMNRTEYLIQGSKQEVLDKVAELERAYHPLGYGTAVVSSNLHDDVAEVYTAVVRRANSCE